MNGNMLESSQHPRQPCLELHAIGDLDLLAVLRTLRFPWFTMFLLCAFATLPFFAHILVRTQQLLESVTESHYVAASILCLLSGVIATVATLGLRELGFTFELLGWRGRGVRTVDDVWSVIDSLRTDRHSVSKCKICLLVADDTDPRLADLFQEADIVLQARSLAEQQPLYQTSFLRSFRGVHAVDNAVGLVCCILGVVAWFYAEELAPLAACAAFAGLCFLARWARGAGLTPEGMWNGTIDAGGLTISGLFAERRLSVHDSRIAVLPHRAGWICCIKSNGHRTELLRLDLAACAMVLTAWTSASMPVCVSNDRTDRDCSEGSTS